MRAASHLDWFGQKNKSQVSARWRRISIQKIEFVVAAAVAADCTNI
jgi:hypothetical protein